MAYMSQTLELKALEWYDFIIATKFLIKVDSDRGCINWRTFIKETG
jgi:hypothetical protein